MTTLLLAVALLGVTSASPREPRLLFDDTFTTPPTTTPMTTPPMCVTPDGHTMFPGQTLELNCMHCYCSYDSGAQCYYIDCLSPMCVNAFKPSGRCCWTCPNGKNCRVPSTGEVIPAGFDVQVNGMICSCPPQDYSLPGTLREENYIAQCIPATTVPSATSGP